MRETPHQAPAGTKVLDGEFKGLVRDALKKADDAGTLRDLRRSHARSALMTASHSESDCEKPKVAEQIAQGYYANNPDNDAVTAAVEQRDLAKNLLRHAILEVAQHDSARGRHLAHVATRYVLSYSREPGYVTGSEPETGRQSSSSLFEDLAEDIIKLASINHITRILGERFGKRLGAYCRTGTCRSPNRCNLRCQ